MSNPETENDKPVFTLLHGRYHGPWVWTYVQEKLKHHGYDSIAPELPLEDPDITLDDLAGIVRSAENAHGSAEYIDVAWSKAGDIAYRKIGASPVSKLVFIAAKLSPIINNLEHSLDMNERNSSSIIYGVQQKAEELGVIEFDPILIGSVLYNELEDEALKALAIGQLRPHPHKPEANSEIDMGAVLPDMDMHYVVCEKDHALPPAWQNSVVDKLGLDHTALPVDHAPMLSFPNLLARRLVKIAQQRKEEVKTIQ